MRTTVQALLTLLTLLTLLAAASCSAQGPDSSAVTLAPSRADVAAPTARPAPVPADADADAGTSLEHAEDPFDDRDDEHTTCSLVPESPSVIAARLGHLGGYDLCGG